jgi:hypothetical protein
MTAFADVEIEVLKQMLLDIRYVKGNKSLEFVSKVVKDSVSDVDKYLIALFSGFLPGARKSGQLSLVKSYDWKLWRLTTTNLSSLPVCKSWKSFRLLAHIC